MGLRTQFIPANSAGQQLGIMDRLHARLGGAKHVATGFVSQPEPRTIGSYARGKQLLVGNFQMGGFLVEAPGENLWALKAQTPALDEERHGFTWLDDLAAIGDGDARALAQDWLWSWIDWYGAGKGLGWSPDLTGRRVIRWINHAIFLLNGRTPEQSTAYFKSLSYQTSFLARRWSTASRGLPRFEALTGLIYAGLALEGMEDLVEPASQALARECADKVGGDGGLVTRNPEELMEVLTLLNWAADALRDHNLEPAEAHLKAIERIVPTLRALRHSDGSLARFHGGGIGAPGWLDQALAGSNVKTGPIPNIAMGFARLSAGRTTLIADIAPPPARASSRDAHASTLAFELTSGRRPIIVNCGAGHSFGPDWRRAGRATPSHSTLSIDGVSSAKLAEDGSELLIKAPKQVQGAISHSNEMARITASHDGYVADFGLTHSRVLELNYNGRGIVGEDTLGCLSEVDRIRFERHMDATALAGVHYSLRFHLHPEVQAEVDMGGSAVSMALKSGEIWVFRIHGPGSATLEPSVYLEKTRLKPRATQQIVLSARVMEYASQVSWSFTKAKEPDAVIRDLEEDLSLALD